ncbi:hypothetical protein U1Q18_028552, partial [Sarracenia purpurea var. burkii]
ANGSLGPMHTRTKLGPKTIGAGPMLEKIQDNLSLSTQGLDLGRIPAARDKAQAQNLSPVG